MMSRSLRLRNIIQPLMVIVVTRDRFLEDIQRAFPEHCFDIAQCRPEVGRSLFVSKEEKLDPGGKKIDSLQEWGSFKKELGHFFHFQ